MTRASRSRAPLLAAALACVAPLGCLENLNEQKWFERLEATAPALHDRVRSCKASIERDLETRLEANVGRTPRTIGLWGATWESVNRPTDGEHLFMKGRIFFDDGRAATYALTFRVADDCSVAFDEVRVFARGGAR